MTKKKVILQRDFEGGRNRRKGPEDDGAGCMVCKRRLLYIIDNETIHDFIRHILFIIQEIKRVKHKPILNYIK